MLTIRLDNRFGKRSITGPLEPRTVVVCTYCSPSDIVFGVQDSSVVEYSAASNIPNYDATAYEFVMRLALSVLYYDWHKKMRLETLDLERLRALVDPIAKAYASSTSVFVVKYDLDQLHPLYAVIPALTLATLADKKFRVVVATHRRDIVYLMYAHDPSDFIAYIVGHDSLMLWPSSRDSVPTFDVSPEYSIEDLRKMRATAKLP